MRIWLLLSFSSIFVSAYAFGSATNAYITSNGEAAGSCPAGPTTYTAAQFSTATNWGSGATQIGAGTTVLVCGAVIGSAGATVLTFQGSGSAGNVITLTFDSGAVIAAPYFGAGGAINLNSATYIVVDGKSTGIVQATLNGTSGGSCPGGPCAYQQNSEGITGWNSNDTLQNLTVANMYVRTSSTDEAPNRINVNCVEIGTNAASFSNVVVHNNVVHDCGTGVEFQTGSTSASNYQASNNTVYNVNWAFDLIVYGNAANFANAYFVGNHTYNLSTWDDTVGDNFHHNAIHLFQGNGDTGTITGLYIYNNEFDGPVGDCCVTALIYVDNAGNSSMVANGYLFNNVFSYANGDCTGTCGNGQLALVSSEAFLVANNTFIGNDTNSSSLLGLCLGANESIGAITVENNLISGCYTNIGFGAPVTFASGQPDYNLYANSGSTAFLCDGNYYSPSQFSQWQSCVGNETHSAYYSDTVIPSCIALHSCGNVQPVPGSKAVGFGNNLYGLCSGQPIPGLGALCYDKSGYPRPSAGNWTVGAFEAKGDVPTAPSTITLLTR